MVIVAGFGFVVPGKAWASPRSSETARADEIQGSQPRKSISTSRQHIMHSKLGGWRHREAVVGTIREAGSWDTFRMCKNAAL
jgi:hypothetical protein